MTTNNIISTPEITGNIGSCTTQFVSIPSKRLGFWREETTQISTNSCTGETERFVTQSFTGMGGFTLVMLICIVSFVVVAKFMDWLSGY